MKSMWSGSKLIVWTDGHTDRQTDMTENITYPHTQVVTRMYSSRIRTACFSCHLRGQGCQPRGCQPSGWGVCLGGGFWPEGSVCQGGSVCLGGLGVCLGGGVSAWKGGFLVGVSAQGCLPRGCLPWGCLPGGVYPGDVCLMRCTPPASVNRMIDRCKNITLPQTLFVGGKNKMQFYTITAYV